MRQSDIDRLRPDVQAKIRQQLAAQNTLGAIKDSGKSGARNSPKGPPREHKYGAVPTTVDGIRFPSKAEAAHYEKLKLLQQAGEVAWFCRQPRFPIEGGEYVADFIVAYAAKTLAGGDVRIGWIEVQDVKGFRTPVYERSKKQVKARYGIDIVEVTK